MAHETHEIIQNEDNWNSNTNELIFQGTKEECEEAFLILEKHYQHVEAVTFTVQPIEKPKYTLQEIKNEFVPNHKEFKRYKLVDGIPQEVKNG
jgi:hypothetical protein